MLKFFKTHQKLSFFLAYLIIGIIFALPVIFLISQNLAVDLGKFQEFGKFFEKVKDLQGGGLRDLIFHPRQIFSLFSVFFIIHRFLGEPFGFNLFWISLFVFGAMGGYCLFKQLIESSRLDSNNNIGSYTSSDPALLQKERGSREVIIASFLSGIFFGLLSLYFPVTSILLFFLFCLFKFLDKPRVKFAIPALILFLVLVNYSLFIGISTLLVVLLIIAFWVFAKLKISRNNFAHNKTFLIKTLILLVLFILIFSTKYYSPLRKVEPFILDNSSFVTQSIDSNFLTKSVTVFSIQNLVILFIVIICFVFTILAWRNRKKNLMISFVLFAMVLFLLFALGPYLRFGDDFYQPKIPLPYLALYYYFPFFNQTLEISGFLVYFWIFLILGVSFGISIFFERATKTNESRSTSSSFLLQKGELKKNFTGSRQARTILFTCTIILFTLFTFWFFWHPGSQVPNFYLNLDKNKEQFKVLYIELQKGDAAYLYENSLHSNPLIIKDGLFLDNFENGIKKDSATQLVANYLSDNKAVTSDFIERDDKLSSYLTEAGIKYIIFDGRFIDENKGELVKISENKWEEKKFQNLFKLRRLFKILKDDTQGKRQVIGDKIIYEIAPQKERGITIYEGDNWGRKDADQRWMLNDATLTLDNSSGQSKDVELFFRSRSQNELRKLEVYLNENNVSEFTVGPSIKAYVATLNDVKPGKNIVKFRVSDYSDKLLENINETTKTNSVQFSEIKYHATDNKELFEFYKNLNIKDNSKILLLPAEIDKLQDNKNIIAYKDLINKKEGKVSQMPLLDKLYFNDLNLKSIFDVTNRDYYYHTGQEMMERYNIKFIALYKDWLSEAEYSNLAKFILVNFDIESVPYNDDKIVVLQIKQKDWQKQIPFEFVENWGMNVWDKRTGRFFNIVYNEAQMTLLSPENKNIDAKLSFKIENFQGEKRKVKVYLNEDWLDEKSLAEFDVLPMKLGEEKYMSVHLPNLRPQKNEILFKVFKEDDKEVIINKDKGIRMSDFEVERADMPIKKEFAKEVDYCSDKLRPVFEKYNFKKEFYDGFEDEEFTRKNWKNSQFDRFIITQKEKYRGKNAFKFLDQYGSITEDIADECFNKVIASIMIKVNKWTRGADFYFDFINNSRNFDELSIRENKNKFNSKSAFSLVTPQTIRYYNFRGDMRYSTHKFYLDRWVNLKIIWERGGEFKAFEDRREVFKTKNYSDELPTNIRIMITGFNTQNIEAYFDDFILKIE